MVRRLRFSGPKTSIICSPMTSLKTSIKTITYLSDIGCLEIQGASLEAVEPSPDKRRSHLLTDCAVSGVKVAGARARPSQGM
ncbi:hypothetical protein AWP91_09715 [Escherichia coli]|nr:hypothetical protein AWP91_09715 [Escherichia coli]